MLALNGRRKKTTGGIYNGKSVLVGRSFFMIGICYAYYEAEFFFIFPIVNAYII